jgi:hypothetical protein
MLTYTPKKVSSNESAVVAPDSYEPSVYLEVSKEMAEAVKVGDAVAVTVYGKVEMTSVRDSDDGERAEIRITFSKIEMDEGDNEFTDLAED